MSFEKCPEPAKLAVNDPSRALHGYERILPTELAYWVNIGNRADAMFDGSLYGLASSVGTIVMASTMEFEMNANQNYERQRRILLGALSISRLLHKAAEYDGGVRDAIAVGRATAMIDVDNSAEVPRDGRLHGEIGLVNTLLDGAYTPERPTSQWFYDQVQGLYVHAVTPAEPTASLREQLIHYDVTAEFDDKVTLYPFLAAQH